MSGLPFNAPQIAPGEAPIAPPASVPPWFALHVKPRHEKTAHSALSNKGLHSYLPLYPSCRRWSDRSQTLLLPLFPGYLFCRLSPLDKLRVETTPGVRAIVGCAGRLLPVPESEIAAIRIMLASGRPVRPHPPVKEGDFVYIHRGPLQGLEGILVQVKNSWRVVVSVTLLQRSLSIEVDYESVSGSSSRYKYDVTN